MNGRAGAAAELSAAIRRYQRQIDTLDQALAERLRLNRTDLRCLDLLLERPRGARELAEAAGLSQSAVTTVLDRLEGAGYASRVRDDADRRRLLVQLTPAVLTQVGELLGPYAAAAAAQADHYTVEELQLLTRFFDQGSARRAEHARRLRSVSAAPSLADGTGQLASRYSTSTRTGVRP